MHLNFSVSTNVIFGSMVFLESLNIFSLFLRLMDIESEMVKFASYYAATAVAVLIAGYIQVSSTYILLHFLPSWFVFFFI